MAIGGPQEQVSVFLPPQMRLDGLLSGNRVSQMRREATLSKTHIYSFASDSPPYTCAEIQGIGPVAVTSHPSPESPFDGDILYTTDGKFPHSISYECIESAEWIYPPTEDIATFTQDDREVLVAQTLASWKGHFTLREEVRLEGEVVEEGLRPPQIGAIHATLAHWIITSEPATIVMPTGTGKTEVMIALLAYCRMPRLLVVTPTVALRDQTVAKFLSLGLLKRLKVVGSEASLPFVGTLEHQLGRNDEVDEFFSSCNVVVTTMQALSGCSNEAKSQIVRLCSHLFIDESHHVRRLLGTASKAYFATSRSFSSPQHLFEATVSTSAVKLYSTIRFCRHNEMATFNLSRFDLYGSRESLITKLPRRWSISCGSIAPRERTILPLLGCLQSIGQEKCTQSTRSSLKILNPH